MLMKPLKLNGAYYVGGKLRGKCSWQCPEEYNCGKVYETSCCSITPTNNITLPPKVYEVKHLSCCNYVKN